MYIQKIARKHKVFNNMKSSVDDAMLPDLTQLLLNQEDDDVKIVEGQYHTLFIEKMPPIVKEFVVEDDGETFTAVRELAPEHNKYTLFIEQFGHIEKQLHKIIYELRKSKEFDVLEIRIDSPGGFISEGITLYNVMREHFNGRTKTYVDSSAYSMGAMLFSLGDERIIYEDSSLMYHNYSSGAYGKGQEIKSSVDYGDKHFESFFKKKIVDKGFLKEDEYEQMKIGQDFWFNSYDMATRGICTHVIVSGYTLDNNTFLKYVAQDKPIEIWATELVEAQSKQQPIKKEEKPKNKKSLLSFFI